jgi:uncharacterized membrane protein
VSLDQWILALHVLSAFAFVAALVLFWVLIIAVRRTDEPGVTSQITPTAKLGNIAVTVGSLGVLIFGIWLAFSIGNYDLWDGWILAAIVLWFIAAGTGQRSGKEYTRGMEKAEELLAAGESGPSAELGALNRTQHGLLMHTIASVAALLLLIDMIWKPGA